MNHCRLLYLDAHHLRSYRWRHGRLALEESFDATPEGAARFSHHLEDAGRQIPVLLLANVGDEDFRNETIPALSGRDRREVIARKTAQFFPGTPFAAAFSLGQEKSGRRNERMLFHALPQPATLEPWLSCLAQAESALAGIYSTAQLAAELIARVPAEMAGTLVIVRLGDFLRESYVAHGHTLFSRQVAVPECDSKALAAILASEALRLRQYLLGQRQLNRDERLPTLVVVPPESVAAVRNACSDIADLACTVLDSRSLAVRIGLRSPPEDSEAILLHLLARRPPRQQFAPERLLQDYRLLRARRAMLASAPLALAAALLFAAKPLYDARRLGNESQRLAVMRADLDRRHAEVLSSLPALPVDHETLLRVTARYSELVGQQRFPLDAFRRVSRALEAAPAIQLEGIEWKAGRHGEEEITLRGFFEPGPETRPRQMLLDFEAFTRGLRERSGTRLEVLHPPVDASSGGSSGQEEAGRGDFTVRITRPAEK